MSYITRYLQPVKVVFVSTLMLLYLLIFLLFTYVNLCLKLRYLIEICIAIGVSRLPL